MKLVNRLHSRWCLWECWALGPPLEECVVDAGKQELLNAQSRTELSSGHKRQPARRVLSKAARTIKSQFIFPCFNREELIAGDRERETTGPICIKWVNKSVWKVQSVPAPFIFFLPHHFYTQIWDLFLSRLSRHTHKGPQTFLSLGCYQWEPSCCQTHSLHTAKASAVKLLKWHYSGQFFSLYLKCLNVWQTNRSPAHTFCVRAVKTKS